MIAPRFKLIFFQDSPYRALAYLLIACVVVVAIFQFGLPGVFGLDDIPNLSSLLSVNDWRSAMVFVLSNDSGPLGRPVAMLSFALQHQSWPQNPAAFKWVNIAIHLVNLSLLYFISLRLLRYLNLENNSAHLASLLIVLLWAVAPIQVSSVLYVVQRMTLLSSTFVLLGVAVYLYGRGRLLSSPVSLPRTGVLLLSVSACAVLATFTKESGALLYAYIVAIEFGLLVWLENKAGKPEGLDQHFNLGVLLKDTSLPLFWLRLFLLLGVIAACCAVWVNYETLTAGYGRRSFTLEERLLTEGRILWSYVQSILLPTPSALGLYHDDYVVSKSWLQPVTTIVAFSAWGFVVLSAWLLRWRFPVLMFALLWFFSGQLIESTLIALELYFEHRNYIASFGFWFALVCLGILAYQRSIVSKPMVSLLAMIYALILVAVTLMQVAAWATPTLAALAIAEEKPNSRRAVTAGISALQAFRQYEKANEKIDGAIVRFGPYASYELHRLLIACHSDVLFGPGSHTAFDQQLTFLQDADFDNAALANLNELIALHGSGSCTPQVTSTHLLALIKTLKNNKKFRAKKDTLLRMQSLVFFRDGDIASSLASLKSIPRKTINNYLDMAIMHQRLGEKDNANLMLDKVESFQLDGIVGLLEMRRFSEQAETLRKAMMSEKY